MHADFTVMANKDWDNKDSAPEATENRTGDLQTRVEGLERRLEKIESSSRVQSAGISVFYALGMCIAVVLSWSRNASIYWCILHGLFSWAYVAYFAATR